MKTPRVVTSSVVLAVLLGLFFFLPLPVSRIRERGIVQIQPQQFAPVHVQVTGILTKLHVREGEQVKKGHILAEFINTEMENRRGAVKAALETQNQMIGYFEVQLSNVRDPKVTSRLQPALDKARQDKIAAGKALRQIEDQIERLVLRAPMDGVVMNLPLLDEIGRYWEPDQGAPFCTVGDPTKLRVLVPVTPADYDLLRENWVKLRQGEQLAVTIRVQGLENKTWPGIVVDLPEAEAHEIPLTLSTRAGGPLAIKPNSDPKQLQPQAQVYLVGINFSEFDYAVTPGAMAQVKIHCEYRSCAWYCWRWLSQTFHLGLL